MTARTDPHLDALEEKVDALGARLDYVVEQLQEAEARRRQWDELRRDLAPISTEVYQLVARELDEVKDFVAPDDVLRLVKRLARTTRTLEGLLMQVDSLAELSRDLTPLTRDAAVGLMEALDDFERRGYFAFARGGLEVVDRVVTSFTEDDVRQLGDNVVLILQTVKEMTQPEVMRLLQRAAHSMREAEPEEIGLLRLLWRMRDPAVRRGLSRVLTVLRSLDPADAAPDEAPDPTDRPTT